MANGHIFYTSLFGGVNVTSRLLPKVIVRVPADVKAWLAEQAERNSSSQTSEVVRALRDKMEQQTVLQLSRRESLGDVP
jgi:Arc/MetJ-type ribon-helix-helix transcriptional regulator